jgi:CRP-like cAMP-binding protein
VGIGWNMVFVAINIMMLVLLLRERRHLQLDADAALLRRGLFSELDHASFARLLRAGEWVELPPGTRLAAEGEAVQQLHVVADGLAEGAVNGHVVSNLQSGAFVGEMSQLTKAPASVTVTTLAMCRVFRLDRSPLKEPLRWHAELCAGLDRTIGRGLARKLRATSGQSVRAG